MKKIKLKVLLRIYGYSVAIASCLAVLHVFYTIAFLRVPYTVLVEDFWLNAGELVMILAGIIILAIMMFHDIRKNKN